MRSEAGDFLALKLLMMIMASLEVVREIGSLEEDVKEVTGSYIHSIGSLRGMTGKQWRGWEN